MTAKIQTSQSTSTLLDRVLDSVACCSSAEHAFACFDTDECGPPRRMRPWGEAVLPHLRFGPLPDLAAGDEDGGGISSSIGEFHRLFLADDARYGFELFHTKNGDGDVEVGPWRDVTANNNNSGDDDDTFDSTLESLETHKKAGRRRRKRMERTISLVTKITPNDAATIPIEVTNTQTLSMEPSLCVLENKIQFDFEGRAMAGLGTLFIGNDVRGSEVTVRVVLKEGDGSHVPANDVPQKGQDVPTTYPNQNTMLEDPQEWQDDDNDASSSFFTCFSHPLLLPTDASLCGPTCNSSKFKHESSWIKRSNSFVDIHGKQHFNNASESHAHVGASLLSAIKAKNEQGSGKSNNRWTASSNNTRVFNNRFNEFDEMTSRQSCMNPEYQEDVLSCTSRGSLKSKKPIPSSLEFVKASSSIDSEGHRAMRRMILEKDGSMTSNSRRSPGPDTDRTTLFAGVSNQYRGLAMRIEMKIHPGGSSSSSSLARKGSFTHTIDNRVRRNLKKRVSRTWISWAESWCMRMWEEEESNRMKRFKNANNSMILDAVGDRKRKTNVRPVVRKIGEKRSASSSDTHSRGLEVKSMNHVEWNTMEFESQRNSTKWMFVRQTSETLDEEEELGVEVACTLNAAKVPRKLSTADTIKPKANDHVRDNKIRKGAVVMKSRWSRSPYVKKATYRR